MPKSRRFFVKLRWGGRRSPFLGIVFLLLFSLPLWGEEEAPALPGEEVKETREVEEALITVNFQEADIGDVLRRAERHLKMKGE